MDNNEDTYTITGGPLKPHEYVVIKREMSAGDEAWIQNHASKLTGDRKNPQLQLTVGDVRLAALKRMIVMWNLTKIDPVDGKQTPIALSEQAIENLPRRISSFINKVIDELNPDDEESDEDFTHAANGSSGGSSHQRNIVPLKP
jgi:hypothetical protein